MKSLKSIEARLQTTAAKPLETITPDMIGKDQTKLYQKLGLNVSLVSAEGDVNSSWKTVHAVKGYITGATLKGLEKAFAHVTMIEGTAEGRLRITAGEGKLVK